MLVELLVDWLVSLSVATMACLSAVMKVAKSEGRMVDEKDVLKAGTMVDGTERTKVADWASLLAVDWDLQMAEL